MKCDELLYRNAKLERLSKSKAAPARLGLQVRHGKDSVCLAAKCKQFEAELEDGKSGKGK
jgi:hypothetical protein